MERSIVATIAFIERMRLLSLIAGRKYVLIKKYALNKHVRLLTRLYGISREGVSPDPEKVEKVKNYPVSTNPTEVRQFLSLASYYRRFMKDFAKIAKPAKPAKPSYSPTCKDVTWSRGMPQCVRSAEIATGDGTRPSLSTLWGRSYLLGHKVILYSDHAACTSLNCSNPSPKLARWATIVQEMDLPIKHRSGRSNSNADTLSQISICH